MKTSSLSALCGLSAAVLAAGCFVVGSGCGYPTLAGSGQRVTEVRSVPEFQRIEVAGSANVVVEIGSPPKVEVSADDNLIARVLTKVEGGTLEIGMEPGSYDFSSALEVRVRVPALESVGIQGSGDVAVAGLRGERFRARIRGSGDVRASGDVGHLDAEIAGSGSLELYDLRANTAKVSIAGSGDAHVSARDELAASIRGSGDIVYRGSPRVEKSIAGSGDIEPE